MGNKKKNPHINMLKYQTLSFVATLHCYGDSDAVPGAEYEQVGQPWLGQNINSKD